MSNFKNLYTMDTFRKRLDRKARRQLSQQQIITRLAGIQMVIQINARWLDFLFNTRWILTFYWLDIDFLIDFVRWTAMFLQRVVGMWQSNQISAMTAAYELRLSLACEGAAKRTCEKVMKMAC